MRKLLGLLTALICTTACSESVLGAANAGGTLIVSLAEGIDYTTDIDDYCGFVTATSCENALTNGPAIGGPEVDTPVFHVLAAFPLPGGRLVGIVWGIQYDSDNVFIIDYGPCGDFELANSDWPASGSGTAVTWFSVQTDPLVPVYWFNAYAYDGFALDLGPHPTQGGEFGDDSIPSQTDPIAGYGSFGFGSNPGSNVCPVAGQLEGACCFDDGSCTIMTEADCMAAGGFYQGDLTECDPFTCGDPLPGACCFPDDSCQVLLEHECEAAGGVYQGADTVCDPNPCGPTPTVERSWGEIKNQHR